MRRWRGAFLCFDVDCDPGLEVHGEVVGEDGDFLDELFDQRIIELCDVGFLIGDEVLQFLDTVHGFFRWWLSSSDFSFWSRSRKISSAMVAPSLSEMNDSYLEFIEKIKKEIQKQRVSVVMNANTSMIILYWNIGRAILKKQQEEGWGTKVIDRMSKDLKTAFPEMSGFSPRNIKYMRKFAQCWEDEKIGAVTNQ